MTDGLEAKFDKVRDELEKVKVELTEVKGDIAVIKERLTWIQKLTYLLVFMVFVLLTGTGVNGFAKILMGLP